MKTILATTIAVVALSTIAQAQTAPSSGEIARRGAKYLQTCARDTQKDCSRLPDLKGLPEDRASVKAARQSCDALNQRMSAFCTIAADHPPASREVMSAVSDVIDAKKAMSKAILAAKADKG